MRIFLKVKNKAKQMEKRRVKMAKSKAKQRVENVKEKDRSERLADGSTVYNLLPLTSKSRCPERKLACT